MRVLVCGGRNFTKLSTVFAVLDDVLDRHNVDILIHGAARGADSAADSWAIQRGVHVARVPAIWGVHGYAAGPLRNKAMLALKPDLVVAFPGGKGTANMVEQAESAGIPVWKVCDEPQS